MAGQSHVLAYPGPDWNYIAIWVTKKGPVRIKKEKEGILFGSCFNAFR
jgi:hypothetical protein